MKSLMRRIRKMEEASVKKQTIIVWKELGESADEVIERHIEANPEHREAGYDLLVICWQDSDPDGAG